MAERTEAQAAYWKERWGRKARKEALEWLAFQDFINDTPDPKKLARPKGTYSMHYKALAVAYEVGILKVRKATRREKKNVLTYRWLSFLERIMRRCESKAVRVVALDQEPVKQAKKSTPEGTSPIRKPVALVPSGPRRGEVGHTDRVAAGSVVVEAPKYSNMPPQLVFAPDKKRPKLKPGETIDILNATECDITKVPSMSMRHATPDWYNEYWGFVCLGDGDEKYAEIIDRILGGMDGFEACSDDYHPTIQRLWKECVAGILAQLRGQSCSETSEAWRAGYNADVSGLSADQWSESEGRFTESEEKVS